jgi:DNA helicase HerA-like ATPase
VRLSDNFVESFKRRHSVILGMTRSGKTFFAARILKRLQNLGAHTLFVDPKHDKAYEHLGDVCYSPMEVLEKIMLKKRAIVFRPPAAKEQKIEQLDEVIELLFKYSKEDGYKRIRRVVAIDELQLFVKKGNSKAIEMIWTVGAGIGIVGMALTQRVQLLNETAWSQSDNKVLFKMEDRPEYLRSRNLDHYVDNMDKLQDPMNRYAYYCTTGGNKWKLRDPIPATNTNAWDGNLGLSPY